MKLFKTAALAVAVSMVGLAVVGDAMALPAYGYEKAYYSDATHTVEVGYEVLSCQGEHSLEGTRTSYGVYIFQEKCCVTSGGHGTCQPE